MSVVTTHVLDTSLGLPAAAVAVQLRRADDLLAAGATDVDGRLRSLGPSALPPGRYALMFDTGAYFAGTGRDTLFPEVTVAIELRDDAHVHVPLLISPFGYSTYRGT